MARRPDARSRAVEVLLAVLLISMAAQGAITWSTDGALTTKSTPPPIDLEKGSNADDKRWFKSFTLSSNQTSFTAEVKPRSGAHVYIEDVVLPTSADDEQRTITLTGTQVTNVNVEKFEWEIFDGITPVGQLDHKDASPSTSFTLPANGQYRMDLEIDLADGAGKANAGISFTVQMEVT